MSRVLSASDIGTMALRAIGEFPVTESSPDGAQLAEAMRWLDLIMGELAGTERMFRRDTPALLALPITNGTKDYDLYSVLGTQLPPDQIQFVVRAWLQDDSGNRYPLEIVGRDKFESVAKPAETGIPAWLFIDKSEAPAATPFARIFPTPATTDPRIYTVQLEVQRFAPNVAPSGVTGTQPSAAVLHDFGQAWQRYLVLQLAHDIGSGPVTKLGENSLTRFANMAAHARERLLAFENREKVTTPPVCDPAWDYCDGDYGVRGNTDYGNRRMVW